MLGSKLTILNLRVELFGISNSFRDIAESLPIQDFSNEIESLFEIIIEVIKDDFIKILNSELTVIAFSSSLALDLLKSVHLFLKNSCLVFLKCLVLLLFLLELSLQVLNLSLFGLQILLRLIKSVLGHLSISKFTLVLLKGIDLLLFLSELVSFLLSNIGKSLALKEQLLQIGCAIVVVSTNLGSFGRVKTDTLECLPIESWSVVDLVKGLHELLIILITRETR